jgi:hypothetical protein
VRLDDTASRVDTVDGSCLLASGHMFHKLLFLTVCVSWCGHRYGAAAVDGTDIASQSAAGAARHCCIGIRRVATGR